VESRYYYPQLTGLPDAAEWREIAASASGEASSSLADALPPLLDGTHSLEAIYGSLLQQGFALDALPRVFHWLELQGLLRESPESAAGKFSSSEKELYQSQTLAFAQLTEPRRMYHPASDNCAGWSEQARLKQATVILFGIGRAGKALASSLVQSGVGRIIAAPDNAARDDLALSALQAELHQLNPHVEFLALTQPEEIPERLGEVTPDLLLYCPDRFDDAFCFWLNSVSLDIKVPLLLYRQRTLSIDLGPLIIPGDTACYTCYERRRMAAQQISEQQAISVETDAGSFRPVFGTDLLALEVLKFLSHAAEPITRSRVWRLNLMTGLTEVHPVLKLPRCPACGVHKARPPRKLWEELE
jgi:molybdopterin-synthase adenylyltransferase